MGKPQGQTPLTNRAVPVKNNLLNADKNGTKKSGRNQKMFTRTLAAFCLLVLAGCSTIAVGPLPTMAEEFSRPLDELRTSYPEIKNYEIGSSILGHCADINQVIAKLGKPDEVQTEWVQMPLLSLPLAAAGGGPGGAFLVVVSFGMYPQQPKNHIWRRGRYTITARTALDISCRYDTRIFYIKWDPLPPEK